MCSGIWTCYELYALASSWNENLLGDTSSKKDSVGMPYAWSPAEDAGLLSSGNGQFMTSH